MEGQVATLALRIGGWANILIGVGHILAMLRLREISEWVGGPGDRIASIHPSLPYLLTLGTGLVFIAFGLYALSACGDFRRLPLSRLVVLGITWIYLVRTVGGVGIGGFLEDVRDRDFLFSSIALVIAILYGVGARSLLLAR
jgi:hypothetical protein